MSDPAQLQMGFNDIPSKKDRYFAAWKGLAKGIAENVPDPIARLQLAQAFCGNALTIYWQEICKENGWRWEMRIPPFPLETLNENVFPLSGAVGSAAAGLSVLHAGYLISSFYTATSGLISRLLLNKRRSVWITSPFIVRAERFVPPSVSYIHFIADDGSALGDNAKRSLINSTAEVHGFLRRLQPRVRPPLSRRHILPHAIGTRLSRLRMERRCTRRLCDQEFQRLVVQ